jgi:cytochrome c
MLPEKFACLAGTVMLVVTVFGTSPGGYGANGPTGDAVHGKTLFEKRCTGCHSLDQAKEGPPLRTVYGRKAGTVASFQYSDAFKGVQITWDDVSLDKWLTDTESVIPNNDMAFRVPSAEERADIIAFLRSAGAKASHP